MVNDLRVGGWLGGGRGVEGVADPTKCGLGLRQDSRFRDLDQDVETDDAAAKSGTGSPVGRPRVFNYTCSLSECCSQVWTRAAATHKGLKLFPQPLNCVHSTAQWLQLFRQSISTFSGKMNEGTVRDGSGQARPIIRTLLCFSIALLSVVTVERSPRSTAEGLSVCDCL